MPLVAVMGSLGSGVISDKLFKGHRSPVAMVLYFMVAVVICLCGRPRRRHEDQGRILELLLPNSVSLAVNATHSIVGAGRPDGHRRPEDGRASPRA